MKRYRQLNVSSIAITIFHFYKYTTINLSMRIIQDSEALTFHSDIEGSAGSSMLILCQAAILSCLLRRDIHNLQHRELACSYGACQLPILQPGQGWSRTPHGVTVQGQRGALNYCHGVIHNRFTRRVCKKKIK